MAKKKNIRVEQIGESVYNIPDIMADEIMKAYSEWLSHGASFVLPENQCLSAECEVPASGNDVSYELKGTNKLNAENKQIYSETPLDSNRPKVQNGGEQSEVLQFGGMAEDSEAGKDALPLMR